MNTSKYWICMGCNNANPVRQAYCGRCKYMPIGITKAPTGEES